MLRVAVILLRAGALIYIAMATVPGLLAAFSGRWLNCLVLLLPGLAFGFLLLWLSMVVARGRHLWLAIGLLAFFGASTAVSTVMIYLYNLGTAAVVITSIWSVFLLGVAGLICFSRTSVVGGDCPPGCG
jgi:hypothetical protein